MKRLTVIAAGFGWNTLERSGRTEIAGLKFAPKPSVFPAVTCVAQASLRTGLAPSEHGMISNGWWSETLAKPLFWEQSARLVKGRRVWADRRAAGGTVGMFFFQQSLGEEVDVLISPAPIHKHGGGMVMSCYTKPTELAAALERRFGKFPLWRYWGPLASPKIGRTCIDWFEAATEIFDVNEAYLYLPTLDYAAQKYGPGSKQDRAAFAEFSRQLERIADICQKRGCELLVSGDYEITAVTQAPVRPNVMLRQSGLFKTRMVGGRAYPDFYQSTAFAMCDHEFCVVYGPECEKATELLLATGDYEMSVGWGRSRAKRDLAWSEAEIGEARRRPPSLPLLLARQGAWCEYKWWTDSREAPDYASHVDIHNKPGYDPTELFFFGHGIVRGTHGRPCEVTAT